MNIDDEHWKTDYIEGCSYYNAGEYEKALMKVNSILSFDKNNIYARNLKASILIESWDGDANTKHNISEAISHLKNVIQNDTKNKNRYLLNLGNAFSQLARYNLEADGKLSLEIITDFQKAKRYFQESLSICEDQPDVWINQGNILDDLGRHFEAGYCYDRAILLNPQHYNAWGNLGICYWRLSNLVEDETDKKKLYLDAMIHLAIELNLYPSFELEDSYKKRVNDFIQQNKKVIDLEKAFKGKILNKGKAVKETFNLNSEQPESFKDFYFNFCEMYNLFLNAHFNCNNCGCSTSDTIKISFCNEIRDETRLYEFSKRWFSIIDNYKTARFYLALSQYRHPDFLFLDDPRNESDSCLNYYSNVEIFKSAFLTAFNIYDKVAFFLNYYEELGIEDKDVSFWDGNSIFTIKGDLLKKEEYSKNLVALYTIKKEIEKNEFTKIKEIRNLITHRYLVLHDIGCFENSNYHMDIHEFFKSTLYMLLQIKNIIFSIVSFILEKEDLNKKKGRKKWRRIPTLELEQNWENDDETTKIVDEITEELNKAIDKLASSIFEVVNKK